MNNSRTFRVAASGAVLILALAVFLVFKKNAPPHFEVQTASALVRTQTPPSKSVAHADSQAPAKDRPQDRKEPAYWNEKFHSSLDYLAFVKAALPSALQGDGRASWYIAEALHSCAAIMKTFHDSPDPQAQLDQELATLTKSPQWVKDITATRTNRCLGLAKEDPFSALPRQGAGYASSDWYQRALAQGDPLAQEKSATTALTSIWVGPLMPSEKLTELVSTAQTELRSAVQSGDPDALFEAGLLLADSRYSSDPLAGVAVALAACDLGRDCSSKNPDNSFANCRLSGACPADADFAYFMQQSLGPDSYAQAYARAQEVKDAVRNGDWDVVMSNLQISISPPKQ